MEPLRLLEVIPDNRLGGISVRALNVAIRLRREAVETIFVVPDEEGDVADRCRDAGFTVYQITLPRPSLKLMHIGRTLYWMATFLVSFFTIKRLIRRHDAHVVHVNGLMNMPVGLAARSEGVPLIWHLAATLYPKWMVQILVPYIRRHATVICISRRVREYFLGRGPMAHNEWIIPEPVDVDYIDHELKIDSHKGLRAQFEIPSEGILCVSVGNISPRKGLHVLIDAAAALKDHLPNLYYVVIGERLKTQRRYVAQIEKAIATGNLAGRFYLAGKRDNVCALMRDADIFVLPSLNEGTPISILEAMACRLPVLATAVGGIPDQITNYATGMLIPAADTSALVESLELLANNRQLRCSLGNAARQCVQEKYSMDTHVSKFLKAVRASQDAWL